MRKLCLVSALLVAVTLSAQSLEEQYRAFQQAAEENYNSFREAANARYAEFLRSAWEYFEQTPGVPRPKEDPVPPVIYKDEKKKEKDEVIEATPVPQPTPKPVPQPVEPVIEDKQAPVEVMTVDFYGTKMEFRFPSDDRLSLQSIQGERIAENWEQVSKGHYENLLYDCVKARDTYRLSDWAYLELLQMLTEAKYGASNEAVLLQAYLYANSGYKMRIGASPNGRIYLLVGSEYILYDRAFYSLSEGRFFPMTEVQGGLAICQGTFEQEQPFSLMMDKEQLLMEQDEQAPLRKASSGLTASCSVNRHLIDFYNNYPTGQYGEDFGTRWAAYANTPMPERIRKELYPALQEGVRGVPEAQAVNKLLNWVQTAFQYEYDDKVWGHDRAFFPAESLYYPYCDCEDRSILFSRIVRDLLDLDVVLLYYPGHLATAVHLNQDANGDYLVYGGKKFIVCDPTYIGAPMGRTMPDMDNATAKVIPLIR